jgi:hypothetical protein
MLTYLSIVKFVTSPSLLLLSSAEDALAVSRKMASLQSGHSYTAPADDVVKARVGVEDKERG